MSKTVVVVGASRGIGLALVEEFAQRGYSVVALSRKRNEDLEKVERVQQHSFDLAGGSVRQAAEAIFATLPKIDILINNAGYLVNKPFGDLQHEELQYSYQVNVIGVMETVQAALPQLQENAHIVNISSMGGFQGSVKFSGLAAYSTSKAALCSFTELFSEEFKTHALSMNCLCLGAVQTEMLSEAFPGYEAPTRPEEMALFIANFAEEAHRFIKGKIIPVSLSTP